MIGISEGMVLAERYRLVRRHEDLGAGEFWGAVDQETGSEAWVCFSDRPGLGEIAEKMREWKAPATPRILDSGEVRLILDSRTLGAPGATGRAATHVEVAVEFAVQEPALGKPLPGRFARRPLPPAEALALVALLAGALEEALESGYSHGWLTASSAWNLRRRVCLVDLAAGLATLDSEPVEIADQVSGYFAPERISGGPATEAADVFALGWLLYAALVGQANLDAYYSETVSAAGSASTAELLALWRERSREHVAFLLAEDEALAALLLAALADTPAARPTLAAFRATATESARTYAGAAALVAYQPKKRPVAAAAAAMVAAEAAVVAGAVVAGAAMESVAEGESASPTPTAATAAATGGAVAAGAVVAGAAMESAAESESAETAPTSGMAAAAGGAVAAGAVVAAAAMESASVEASESAATSPAADTTAAAASASEGFVGAAAGSRRHRERPRIGVGLLVACALGLLMIGLGSGYAFGASGNQTAANSKSGIGLGAVVAATTPAACAPTATSTASAAAAVATATWNENAALPLPTSTSAAVTQLGQIVQGAQSSGLISSGTASTLTSEIRAVQSAIASGGGYSSTWQTLSTSIQNGRSQGTIPQALSVQLLSALSYLSQAAGS